MYCFGMKDPLLSLSISPNEVAIFDIIYLILLSIFINNEILSAGFKNEHLLVFFLPMIYQSFRKNYSTKFIRCLLFKRLDFYANNNFFRQLSIN